MAMKRRFQTCSHCGEKHHQQPSCAVAYDGRREADEHDKAVNHALLGERSVSAEARSKLAAVLRKAAA